MFPFQPIAPFLHFFDEYQCHNIIHLVLVPDTQKESLLFTQIRNTFLIHTDFIFLGAL